MHRERLLQIVFLALAGVALTGAALLQGPLQASRQQAQIVPLEDLPPGSGSELTLLQAMPGGLRALAIDYLWIRSQQLKQEGKLYDAKQLAELITRLQPRFPGVWVFHSWNLAWNLSVTSQMPAERWHWVSSGLELLRDRGIPYNPRNLQLYRELSWLFFSKIGGTTDEMHMYYKQSLAKEFHRLLGGPPRSRSPEAMAEWIAAIADAPASRAQLNADPEARAFLAELAKEGLEPDLAFIDAYNAWANDPATRIIGQPEQAPTTDRERRLAALMTDPAHAAGRAKTLAFARRQTLVQHYHMDPQWMAAMTGRFGPIDWRLPWTHALYWSTYGDHVSNETDIGSVNSLNNDRNILNSLKALTGYGNLTLVYDRNNPELPFVYLQPEMGFVDVANAEFVLLGRQFRAEMRGGNLRRRAIEGEEDPETTYIHFEGSHLNYLTLAIQAYYFLDPARGEQLLKYIRDEYRLTDPKWELAIEPFVVYTLNQEGEMPHQQAVEQLLNTAIRQAYVSAVTGDDERAESLMQRAHRMYQNHREQVTARRLQLPDFVDLQAAQAMNLLMGELPPLAARELYRELPVEIQRRAYLALEEMFRQQGAQDVHVEVKALFPPPPGMEQFRQQHQRPQAGAS